MRTGIMRAVAGQAIAATVLFSILGGGLFYVSCKSAYAADMPAAKKLLAIEDIHQLKARYFRCVDTKDWDCFLATFAPDVTFKTGGLPERHGREGMMQLMHDSGFFDRLKSVHHGFMPEIEILSPTTARGIWTMEDIIYYPAGLEPQSKGEALSPGQTLHGYGHYHETYVKIKGQWLIQTEELTRTRVDITGVTFK